jgi:signal-transduction protein with cAMP-binding, CBS, and nucleotidyltransferase domain
MNDNISAKDIATTKPVYIDGLATAKEAVATMKKHNIEVLVIQKRNDKDANGILVVSDIVRNVIIPDKNLEEVSVYEIMTKPVISIPASLNARYVPRLLMNAKINHAPVEENGEYIGMIDLRDFLFNLD